MKIRNGFNIFFVGCVVLLGMVTCNPFPEKTFWDWHPEQVYIRDRIDAIAGVYSIAGYWIDDIDAMDTIQKYQLGSIKFGSYSPGHPLSSNETPPYQFKATICTKVIIEKGSTCASDSSGLVHRIFSFDTTYVAYDGIYQKSFLFDTRNINSDNIDQMKVNFFLNLAKRTTISCENQLLGIPLENDTLKWATERLDKEQWSIYTIFRNKKYKLLFKKYEAFNLTTFNTCR